MSILKWIFKSDKETGEAKFVGQTANNNFKHLHDITQRVTEEKPISGSATDNTTSFQTKNHYVDFVDKSTLNDEVDFSKLNQNPNFHVQDDRIDIDPIKPWFLLPRSKR